MGDEVCSYLLLIISTQKVDTLVPIRVSILINEHGFPVYSRNLLLCAE